MKVPQKEDTGASLLRAGVADRVAALALNMKGETTVVEDVVAEEATTENVVRQEMSPREGLWILPSSQCPETPSGSTYLSWTGMLDRRKFWTSLIQSQH